MSDASPEAEDARLCEAVVGLVAEHGYAETSLAKVLKRSGLDRDAFKRHFKSLEDACCVAYEELSLQFAQGTVAAFVESGAEAWVDQMRAAGGFLYSYVLEDSARARFIYIEFPTISARTRTLRDRTMRTLITLVDRGRFERDDPDSVPHATAEAIAGAIYDRVAMAIRNEEFDDGPEIAADLTYMAIQPYLGTEAAREAMERGLS